MTQLSAERGEAASDSASTAGLPHRLQILMALVLPGLAFGPLLMVIPTGSIIAFGGALLLGFALCAFFVVVTRAIGPRA